MGILLSYVVVTPAWAELELEEINSIARQTTVLIAPALTPELLDELEANRNNPLAREAQEDGVWNPGSGVIVARQGQTYSVLTVTHNFKQRYLDQNLSYGIRTSDGQVHVVDPINDRRGCPLQHQATSQQMLLRFGCYSRNIPNRVAGIDLAIVRFFSERDYPVAALGDPDAVNIGDTVYISGWPDPEKEKDARTGQCQGKVERRTRRLAWGPVTAKLNNTLQSQNGYGIFYIDELTRSGMSGGPVFDSNGLIVGIHGRGSVRKGLLLQQYCSQDEVQTNYSFESADIETQLQLAQQLAGGPEATSGLYAQFSSAQNLNNLPRTTRQVGINLSLEPQLYTDEVIRAALTPLQAAGTASGTLDFAAREDVTDATNTTENPNDVVNNIYRAFQLENMLRDKPSSGCRFLLLGEPCP